MLIDKSSLSLFLAGAGVGTDEQQSAESVIADRLLREALSRQPLEGEREALVESLVGGASVETLRVSFYELIEGFVSRGGGLGSASEMFRGLSAQGAAVGEPVAPSTIGECIAAYRILLGRDPDPAGFRWFVEYRVNHSLAASMEPMASSAEAAGHHGFGRVPEPAVIAPLCVAIAQLLVHGAVADATLAVVFGLRNQVDVLQADIHELKLSVARLTSYIELRLDAQDRA